MIVNKKKNIRLLNNTKYFDPDRSRSHNIFSSPDSYQSRNIKQEGYETRLYWQFRECEDKNGQAFFYTLTYNDEHMPKYLVGYELDKDNVEFSGTYGYKGTKMKLPKKPKYVNCFDYEDLRDLVTGGFYQKLRRDYGTKLKYFIGAELGDGKGERGLHNNPHYHVMFFLLPDPEPINKKIYEKVPIGTYRYNTKHHKAGETKYKRVCKVVPTPYTPITPEAFRTLVRRYWQGFDEDIDGVQDYRTAKYGIAREGENCGKVTDYRACMYCAKYVCKDVKLRQCEDDIERFIRIKLRSDKYDNQVCEKFFNEVIYPTYSHDGQRTKQEVLEHLLPDCFDLMRMFHPHPESFNCNEVDLNDYPCWFVDVPNIMRVKKRLWKKYFKFRKAFIEEQVHNAICEWRNRYCNKCRCSQGVGCYALDFITDKLNPQIQVPSKKGMKTRPLPMYYYRKLFTEVVVPVEEKCYGMVKEIYSPIRILNEDGIKYKVAHLQQRIDKVAEKARSNMALLVGNEELYDTMRNSDVNTENFMTYSAFLRNWNYLLNENNNIDIYEKYGIYKMVYEDRFFAYNPDSGYNNIAFPQLDYLVDYENFIKPTLGSVARSDTRLTDFIKGNLAGYLPYSQHPDFLRYLGVFRVFDMCSDYWFVQNDNKNQADAEERARVKRFHDSRRLKEFYARFK